MTNSSIQQGVLLTQEQKSNINAMAMKEGWALFDIGQDETVARIQRDDEAGVFANDDDAIEHIEKCAKAGSVLHKLALLAHNTPEDFEDQKVTLSQNDLDELHAEGFQQWADADTISFQSVDPVPAATTRQGRLPLTGDQMGIIDEMAQREGWLLSEHSGGSFNAKFMIDKFDEDPRFANDDEALAFVRKLAEAGSDYHQLALAAHDKLSTQVLDTTVVKVKVTLEIDYRLNGIGLPVVHKLLRENIEELIGDEGLVEHLPCETTDWSISIQ
jgi:hypothetical protein